MLGTILAAILTVFPNSSPDSGYADFLYSSGEYELAAGEYLRIIYANDADTISCPLVSLRLAGCLRELDRFSDALFLYTFLGANLPDRDMRAGALMGAGAVLEEIGEFTSARLAYVDAVRTAVDIEIKNRADIMAGLMYARMGRWDSSAEELSRISSSGGPFASGAEQLAEIVSRGSSLPVRSPFWCGLSSAVLPGSGQMICGHFTDGVIALGVNGLMGYLFYESLREENTTTSVLLGWLSLSFYGGNIYGGSKAARTYNSARRRELLEEITGIIENEYIF
jgi:tetratricopeptide (TPR) repeat protein